MSKSRISSLEELITFYKEAIRINNDAANKLGIGVLDENTIDGIQKSIRNLEKAVQDLKDNSYSRFLKTNNVFSYRTGDGISYTEQYYIKIIDETPDWRGEIKVSQLVVGCGDYGKWIKYDNLAFISLDELAEITTKHNIILVDETEMQKYIDFSNTIPYGD